MGNRSCLHIVPVAYLAACKHAPATQALGRSPAAVCRRPHRPCCPQIVKSMQSFDAPDNAGGLLLGPTVAAAAAAARSKPARLPAWPSAMAQQPLSCSHSRHVYAPCRHTFKAVEEPVKCGLRLRLGGLRQWAACCGAVGSPSCTAVEAYGGTVISLE